jgi:hypothetical protein
MFRALYGKGSSLAAGEQPLCGRAAGSIPAEAPLPRLRSERFSADRRRDEDDLAHHPDDRDCQEKTER